jgi:flagellar basal body-associated protein FliL
MRVGYGEGMASSLALILAADPGRGGQDPGGGLSALLIVLVVIGIVVAMAVLFLVVQRLTRGSRGGVQPKTGEFERGGPPFESFGRRK